MRGASMGPAGLTLQQGASRNESYTRELWKRDNVSSAYHVNAVTGVIENAPGRSVVCLGDASFRPHALRFAPPPPSSYFMSSVCVLSQAKSAIDRTGVPRRVGPPSAH